MIYYYLPFRRRRGGWRRFLPIRVGKTTGNSRPLWYLRVGPFMWVFS